MPTKITALPVAASVAATDIVPVVVGAATTKSATITVLRTAMLPIVDADVGAGAAVAGTKVAPDFGSQTVTTTGNVLLGATPRATVGIVRFPNLANGQHVVARNAANSADYILAGVDSSDNCVIGGYWDGSKATTQLFLAPSTWIFLRINGTDVLQVSGSKINASKPILGDSGTTSPYGVHGKTTVATAAPFTVAAADYLFDTIVLSEATAGTVTFPLPAADSGAYTKFIINTGAGTKTISNGAGAPSRTVTLLTTQAAIVLFDTRGAHARVTPFAYTE